MKNILLFILVTIIYLSTVFYHENAGIRLIQCFSDSTRTEFDRSFMLLVGLSLGLFSMCWGIKIYKIKKIIPLIFFLLIQTLITYACYYYLIILNSEGIHFLQYGLISFLLFVLFRHNFLVLLISLLAGFFDEYYQYIALPNFAVPYYDFNDVVLDLVGTGWALIFANGMFTKAINDHHYVTKNKICAIVLFAIMIFTFILFQTGFISYAPTEQSYFSLVNEGFNSEYWIHLKHGVVYHILRPWEALITISIISILYLSLDLAENRKLFIKKVK